MNSAIHLTDPNFQSQHSGKCNLLIRITKQRLSYAIVDQGNDRLKVLFDSGFEGGTEALRGLVQNDPFLKFHFHKVKISVESSKFTFIPREVYSDTDLDFYALFVRPGSHSDVLVKDIRSAKIKNIVAIDKSLREYLSSHFMRPLIFNQANPLIEPALKLYRNSPGNTLLLQFNSGSFEAIVMGDTMLRYYNLFSIDSADELNYYVLAIIQELELSDANTVAVLCGYIDENDEYYSRIWKYFGRITFADSNALVRQSEIFRDIPAHRFFSLIGLNVCE